MPHWESDIARLGDDISAGDVQAKSPRQGKPERPGRGNEINIIPSALFNLQRSRCSASVTEGILVTDAYIYDHVRTPRGKGRWLLKVSRRDVISTRPSWKTSSSAA
jgi:hypothetical protein